MLHLPKDIVISIVKSAIYEDAPYGDITTNSLIPQDITGEANIVCEDTGILAGINVALQTFLTLDSRANFKNYKSDGDKIFPNDTIAHISGNLAALLTAERTAINFLQRMSGIATLTNRYVQAVSGKCKVADTRKTAPGLRMLDKYSVAVGGGHNHRFGLSDGTLIKDNHIQAMQNMGYTITEIVSQVRANVPHTIKIEIEANHLSMALKALDSGVDAILLDNMHPDLVEQVVVASGGKCITEASGNITLNNITQMADTGVNIISVGAITHSVKALNISLDVL